MNDCFYNFHSVSISVIIPSYNETVTLMHTISSLQSVRYDNLVEMIVVDDGIDDIVTSYVLDTFDMHPIKNNDTNIKNVYVDDSLDIPFYLMNKEHGLKASAINAGIALSHYDYVFLIDADTIVDPNAFNAITAALDDDVIALGGRVKVNTTSSSNIFDQILTFTQSYEYDFNFLIHRVSLSNMNILFMLSGAMTFVKKSVLVDIGCLDTATLGEDFDLTLRLQQYACNHHSKVKHVNDAICITDVPYTLLNWYKQRIRWHRGFLEVMHHHMFLLEQCKPISIVLVLTYLYEHVGIFIEIICLLTNSKLYLYLCIIYALFQSLMYLCIDQDKQGIWYLKMFYMPPILMIYHFMNITAKLTATLIYYLTLNHKDKCWGIQKRKEE